MKGPHGRLHLRRARPRIHSHLRGRMDLTQVYGFLRSPRVSEDGAASPTVQPHYVYLRVAHQFAHCTKSHSAGGKHVIVSGVMRNEVKDTAWEHGFRAGTHHIMMPYDQDDNGQAHFSKLMFHECLKHIMGWSSRTQLFHNSQSASGFMNQHVLYHESVSISPHFVLELCP